MQIMKFTINITILPLPRVFVKHLCGANGNFSIHDIGVLCQNG